MPLSPRTVMMSLIAVPAALLANLFANLLVSPAGFAQEAFEPRRSPPLAVPRQVLLIDLNPVLDFGALEEWDSFAQPLYEQPWEENPALLEVAPVEATARVEPAARDAGSGASSFAAALAPRPGELFRSGVSPSRVAVQARPQAERPPQLQPQPQQWNAPFPSLGQLQLDQQLRRYWAYLETMGQPDILIVGGQGAAQGVDPLVLQESLGDRGYSNLKVFNWGLSDSSAQTVEWLLTELLTPQQLPKLVVWADSSVALNGERQDVAFRQIQASPGHRFLARGLRPKISDQERQIAQKLGQILSNPGKRALPASVLAWARSPSDGSANLDANTKADAKNQFKPSPVTAKPAPKQDQKQVGATEGLSVGSTAISQATPILIDARARVLPILMPQKPLALTAPPAKGLANTPAAQPEVSEFRLVNWCRNANGPCQAQEGQSAAALVQPPAPAWLRQTQAAQEAAAQQATNQRANESSGQSTSRAASLQARRTQASVASPAIAPRLMLPDWPQSQAAKELRQAMGFQSVDQRLGVSSAAQSPALRGDQDSDYRNFSLQGEQNRALHRLVQFGQQQGVAIAFVQLPLSQQYLDIERQSREQSFRTYLEVAAQMTPLNLVELSGDGLAWNDALFAQPHRLNRYGAAALSWQVGQALEGSLLRGLR